MKFFGCILKMLHAMQTYRSRNEIVKEITRAKFFSTMVDEAAGVNVTEHSFW